MTPNPPGRYPLLIPLGGAISGILLAWNDAWPILALLVAAGLGAGLWFRKAPVTAAALFGFFFALNHSNHLHDLEKARALLQGHDRVTVTGILTRSSRGGLVEREFRSESGARIALYNLPPVHRTGEKLVITGRGIRERPERNPGEWSLPDALLRQGFAGGLLVEGVEDRGKSSGWARLVGWSETLRGKLDARLTGPVDSPEDAAIIRGIFLGEKGSDELMEDFRKTGTMHVFAVSGLHVGLVAMITFFVLRISTIRKGPALVSMMLVVSLYVLVTGLRPPALRAAFMAGLFAGGFLMRRRASILNFLFAAAIVVLALDGFQIRQPGFQLSFLVVFVILLLEPSLWRRIEPVLREDPYLPRQLWSRTRKAFARGKEKFARMFTVSLTAWTGSAPLTAFYFGWFSPVAALASVPMVMLAFVILCLSFLTLTVGSLSDKTYRPLAILNGGSARLARYSASQMGGIPGSWYRVRAPAPWAGGLAVFDIPYGGAGVHLDAGGGVLIDGGSSYGFGRTMGAALDRYHLSCDTLIASHADEQHAGGLVSAMAAFPIRQIMIPIGPRRTALGLLESEATRSGIPVINPRAGAKYPVAEGVELEILRTGGELGRADDRGLVAMVSWQGWRILFTGDAGYFVEKELLESGLNLRADVWVVGRHLDEPTGHDQFVNAVRPAAIIASDTNFPVEESVPHAWRRWLENQGVAFFSQKETGAVFLKPATSSLEITTWLDHRKLTLRH